MSDPLKHRGGFADLVGYDIGAWRADYAEVLLEVAERHINRSGVMHGGVLTTLIDTACGLSGCYAAEPEARRAFTLALNCHFLAAAPLGARLAAAARRTGGGRQIFFALCEVRDQDDRLIGQGDGVFRYLSDAPND